MRSHILFIFFLIQFTLNQKSFAQETAADSLLTDLALDSGTDNLLPDKMMPVQRLFWGKKGFFRAINLAPELTPENRQKELKIRRTMLTVHPTLGILTAAGMVGQGILGSKIYNFDFANKPVADFDKIRNNHETLATAINIGYTSTAIMAFLAPPKQVYRKGISNIKVHKALSYIHLSGMIATNVLARKVESNPNLKPYHRAAAYTTFGAFAVSMVIMKFEF